MGGIHWSTRQREGVQEKAVQHVAVGTMLVNIVHGPACDQILYDRND